MSRSLAEHRNIRGLFKGACVCQQRCLRQEEELPIYLFNYSALPRPRNQIFKLNPRTSFFLSLSLSQKLLE